MTQKMDTKLKLLCGYLLGHKSSAQLLGILFWIQHSANSPNYRMLLAVVCTLLTYLLVQLN